MIAGHSRGRGPDRPRRRRDVLRRTCRLTGSAALVAIAIGVGSAPARGQSATEIVQRMLDEYERRAEGIDNYALVQDAMGFQTVSYFAKEIVDGRPVFRLQTSAAEAAELPESTGSLDEVYAMGEELGRRAVYEGVQRVDDYDLHVLTVTDLSGLPFGRNVSPEAEFEPRSGTFFLDVDTYAPRRIQFEGDMTNAEGTNTVTTTVEMGDYREVEGLLIPYRTLVRLDGLAAAIDPETRAQFEQMQQELENMPPEQRAMVEVMMAGQLEQFRAMMAGEDAPLTVTILVREVLVNQGPPG